MTVVVKKDIKKPFMIAHRGASGYLPENTIESFQYAVDCGAKYIELDVVLSRDGHLMVCHENEIGCSSDVAMKFPGKKTIKIVDNVEIKGWFTEDFYLHELLELRVHQKFTNRSHEFDGQFLIPTLEETIQWLSKQRNITLFVELKNVHYYLNKCKMDMVDILLKLLKIYHYDSSDSPIIILSFESDCLENLRNLSFLKLVQLLHDHDELQYQKYKEYVIGIAPSKMNLYRHPEIVQRAKQYNLEVFVWTFNNETLMDRFKTLKEEVQFFIDLGINGFFTDHFMIDTNE
jgi:glycerophosphoryl diester phosphodiesterase